MTSSGDGYGSPSSRNHGQSTNGEGKKNKQLLPQLRPNINKRAQGIIKAHMQAVDAMASRVDLVPVLAQLDRTAPSTAVTHDISHLRDQATCLKPRLPATLIVDREHVFEAGFLPKDCTSAYSDADGMWHTKSFPSASPSSREDAVMLDAWITKALEHHGANTKVQHGAKAPSGSHELAKAVENLVPILSTALHEMVRQVTHHCPERGVALEKIWKTYVELFDRVLHQLQAALFHQKQRTTETSEIVQARKRDLRKLRRDHPQNLRHLIEDLEHKFTTRHKSAEDELVQAETENSRLKEELKAHQKELEIWYPGFPMYEDSYVKKLVPQISAAAKKSMRQSIAANRATLKGEASEISKTLTRQHMEKNNEVALQALVAVTDKDNDESESMPAEVAIAEDFKRLLAVLAPDKRKLIGQEIGSLMQIGSKDTKPKKKGVIKMGTAGADASWSTEKDQAAKTERVDQLHAEVKQQEARILELRQEVSDLEAQVEQSTGRRQSRLAQATAVTRSTQHGEAVRFSGRRASSDLEDDSDDDGVVTMELKGMT